VLVECLVLLVVSSLKHFFSQNYRIDLTNEDVRSAALEGDLQTLWEADQLRLAMMHKDAFVGYEEASITFA
jgi:hypothetical protein